MQPASPPPAYFKSAEHLLEELGIDSPEDIKIEGIAQYCGATVLYEPLHGSDARILGYGERAFITVNTETNISRQRFSAAHELGHWMWDRGRMAFACDSKQIGTEWGDDNVERRANRYAVDLLLPQSMFARRMGLGTLSFVTAQQLAAEFQTSLTATVIRMVELTTLPAILVSTERERRRWYFRSPHVPRGIKPVNMIRAGSIAHRLLSEGESAVAEPQPVEASAWIDSEGSPLGVVHEDSIRLGDDFGLTLLWWPEGTQLAP